jgi:hypothetical protein
MWSAVAAPRGARLVAVAAVVVLCFSWWVSVDARGATASGSFGYLTTFGSDAGFSGGPGVTGVAVGQATGNVFVAGRQVGEVTFFAPDVTTGGSQIGTVSVNSHPGSAENIAVDPVDDTLYVAETEFGSGIARYVSDHGSPPVYTDDAGFTPSALLTGPKGMVVDPVSQDLLVVDAGSSQVFRLAAADGSTLSSFSIPANARGIAVGAGGLIYVIVDSGARVARFSSTGVAQGSLTLPAGSDAAAIAVNPASGDIAVAIRLKGQTYLEGVNDAGVEQFRARFIPSLVGSEIQGLAWDGGSSGRIYVPVGNGLVRTFEPASSPGVDVPVVSNVGVTGAHVAADVDPAGASTTAHIEYCPASSACDDYPVADANDTNNPWRVGPDHSVTGPDTIEDDLPLNANANWKIRTFAVSTQADGVVTEGVSVVTSFDSPLLVPAVETGTVASLTTSTAELTGTINTVGSQTTYHFEYGTTAAYGSQVPADGEAPAGNSRTPRTVSRTITGLQPGTTYHYRLVARNAAGQNEGVDLTFTTPGAEPTARGYEQVTPVNKRGATVNALIGFQPKNDGSALSYALTSAPSDAPSSVLYTRYVSRRDTADWLRWTPTDPPLNVVRSIAETGTQAVSPDFSQALVVSNRALTPGAAEGGSNIYLKDLHTGAYTLVGASPNLEAFAAMTGPQRENMFLAGDDDFSWIVFMSPASLLPGAPTVALYRWSRSGGLTLQSSGSGDVHMPTAGVELTSRWVTKDGDRMYYNLLGGPVYRHELDGATTPISVVEPGATGAGTELSGKIDGISTDGRYAFFRSGPLTVDAQADGGATYVYRYDAQTGALETVGPAIFANPGGVLGVGNDGRTVFFDTGDGLSSWRDGVRHRFTSAQPDLGSPGTGYEVFSSPNGRYLSYLNGDGTAHLYDAATQSDVCVSCLPDGSGGRDAGLPVGLRSVSNRAPLVVADDGTMFFDTETRLLSADHNGSRDVYSYNAGKLTLISPGDGAFTARFADATPDLHDVYFTTDQSLVGQDTDKSIDVYDARLNGGLTGQSPRDPVGCAKTECVEPGPGPSESPPVVDPQQPAGPPVKQPKQARVRVSVTKASFGSRSLKVSVTVSEAGRLQVSGTRTVKTFRNVAKAGTYSVTVPLTKRARALRAAHRKVKVAIKVTLAGPWGISSVKYSRTLGK